MESVYYIILNVRSITFAFHYSSLKVPFFVEYTNTLRTAAAAAVAASAAANPTSNNSYVGVTRIGTAVTSQPANTSSTTGTSSSSIFQKFSSTEMN